MIAEAFTAGFGIENPSVEALLGFAIRVQSLAVRGLERVAAAARLERNTSDTDNSSIAELTEEQVQVLALDGLVYAKASKDEPPIEKVRGISNREAKRMNRNQTARQAQPAGRERSRVLGKAEAVRQQLGNSGGKAGRDEAQRRRQQ